MIFVLIRTHMDGRLKDRVGIDGRSGELGDITYLKSCDQYLVTDRSYRKVQLVSPTNHKTRTLLTGNGAWAWMICTGEINFKDVFVIRTDHNVSPRKIMVYHWNGKQTELIDTFTHVIQDIINSIWVGRTAARQYNFTRKKKNQGKKYIYFKLYILF